MIGYSSDFTFDPAALTLALGTDEWNGAVEIEQNAMHSFLSHWSAFYTDAGPE